MTYAQQAPPAQFPLAQREAAQWLRRHSVTITALVLIAVQLWWKSVLLGHFYFRQDDFQWQDHALATGLTWSYLMQVLGDRLMPGGLALVWVIARVSVYDWTLASAVTLVLIAASSLALLRLLRTLLGNRPVILIPLLVYLFSPLIVPGLSFFASTVEWLPLQLTTFLAADAHLRYVRTSRLRSALAAAAWVAAGMFFGDAGFAVPFLLFAVTSGFLVPGRWPAAAAAALRRYRSAWLMYGVLAAGYLTVFLIQLPTSGQPATPGPAPGAPGFASAALRLSFVPAALGGPWRWYANGDYGYVLQTPVLTQLSWVVAAVIVIASLCLRRRGWHAWAILAGWVVLCDLLPVIFSRVGRSGGGLLGLDLQYLADSLPVLAICLGLAFWPVDGEQNAYRFALRAAGVRRAAVCVLLGCFLAGSVWSARAYLTDTTSAPVSSYIATATAAVRRAPANTMVIPSPVPAAVMDPGIFGSSASTQQVIDPLARGRLRWTTAPQGQIRNLMIFDSLGRLKAAAVQGPVSLPAPGGRPCWPVLATGTRIPLTGSLYSWTWTVQLWYSGPASTLQVQYGRAVHAVTVPAGSHDVYVPATGGGSALIISSNSASGSAPDCVSRLAVGSLQPSADAIPIPFYPVR